MNIYNEIVQLNKKLSELHNHYWQEEVVFSFSWWFVIATLIFPWAIWWKIVDKKRIREISMVGLFIMLISFLLDQVGAALVLWGYPVTPTPLAREVLDPADLAILPLFYMAIYQYLPKWKNYVLSLILFGFFSAYIGGNIYQWLGIYNILNWKHIYSVPIYIALGIIVKYIMNKLGEIEKRNNKD